jgi:hypothetical protein
MSGLSLIGYLRFCQNGVDDPLGIVEGVTSIQSIFVAEVVRHPPNGSVLGVSEFPANSE